VEGHCGFKQSHPAKAPFSPLLQVQSMYVGVPQHWLVRSPPLSAQKSEHWLLHPLHPPWGGVGAGGVGADVGGVGADVGGAFVGVGSGPGASHQRPPHCPQFAGLEPHQPPEHSPLPVSHPPPDEASASCRRPLRRTASDTASAVSETRQVEKRILFW